MSVEEQVLKLLKETIAHPTETTFTLGFTYEGNPYTTTFTLKAYQTNNPAMKLSMNIHLKNECINIERTVSGFDGEIKANSPKPGEHDEGVCFSPLLRSNRTSTPKVSSIDVLQTLKTKLSLLLAHCELYQGEHAEKHGGKPPDVELIDEAKKNSIRLSSMLLLRGEDAIYEKYGYESKNIAFPAFKDYIKSLTWKDYLKINPTLKPYYAEVYKPKQGNSPVDYTQYTRIRQTTPLIDLLGDHSADETFTEAMKEFGGKTQ